MGSAAAVEEQGLELGALSLGRPHAREQQMRMMEMVHQQQQQQQQQQHQQQQQQQQQWAASMEAAWVSGSGAAAALQLPAANSMPVGGAAAPWLHLPHSADLADLWQLPSSTTDVVGAAVASASESIVRSLLTHEHMPVGSVQLPQHILSCDT